MLFDMSPVLFWSALSTASVWRYSVCSRHASKLVGLEYLEAIKDSWPAYDGLRKDLKGHCPQSNSILSDHSLIIRDVLFDGSTRESKRLYSGNLAIMATRDFKALCSTLS